MSKGAYSAQTRIRVPADEPQQVHEAGPASGLVGQDLEKRVAVIDGTVAVVEPTAAIDEAANHAGAIDDVSWPAAR